jgi:hypothetical protein
MVDTGGRKLGGFHMKVNFDPQKIIVDTVYGNQGVTQGADGGYNIYVNASNIQSGQYQLNGLTANNFLQGSDKELVIVHFKALQAATLGQSDITLQIVEFNNELAEPIPVNESSISTITINQDNVAPAVPVIIAPVNDTTIINNTPVIIGTGEVGATVNVSAGSTHGCTAIVGADGNWACTIDPALSDGVVVFTATQDDLAGNHSVTSQSTTVTINTSNDSAQVSFSPSEKEVLRNESFTLAVMVDTGGRHLGGFHMKVNFDPQKIAIDITQGSQGIVPGDDGQGYMIMKNINNISIGEYAFAGTAVTGLQGQDKELVIVHFTALQAATLGESNITLEIKELNDDLAMPISVNANSLSEITILHSGECISNDGSSVLNGSGESRIRYQSSSAHGGDACQPENQSRTCTNGVWGEWSGLYTFQSCTIDGVNTADDFVITIKTDNQGTSNDMQFTIPTFGTEYDYNVDCDNDGNNDAVHQTGDYTCNYPTSGTYTIRIKHNDTVSHTGFPRIFFNNDNDKEKILSVNQWGTTHWTSMADAFAGCSNLNFVPAIDNGGGDVPEWVVGVPDLSQVIDMTNMFNGAVRFNQLIANWHVDNVENMTNLFNNSGLSDTNYDAILIGWNNRPILKNNVTLDALNNRYCSAEFARAHIVSTYNWIINDAGKCSTQIIRGDVNQDNAINVSDAHLVLRKALNLSVQTWPIGVLTAGDVNCDNNINVADAHLTLRKALQLPVTNWCDTQF